MAVTAASLVEAAGWPDDGEALSLVLKLLADGEHPDRADSKGEFAIDEAANRGRLEIVRALLNAGASPCPSRGWGCALWMAATEGHFEVVERLLQAGATWAGCVEWMEEPRPRSRGTPLHDAVDAGDRPLVERLISLGAGALVETFDDCSRTPLSLAAVKGDTDLVRLLLARGADPNTQDQPRAGFTALDSAVAGGHEAVVRSLLAAGANPNIPTWMWLTAADRALEPGVPDPIRSAVLAGSQRFPRPTYPDGSRPDQWPPTGDGPRTRS